MDGGWRRWIMGNENLLNLVRTYDPQSTYVCLFTDGFEYTETGQELPVLLLSIDEQTKREVESMLKKAGVDLDSTATTASTKEEKKAEPVVVDDGTPKCAACGRKEESEQDKFPVCGRCRQAKVARPAKYCSHKCQQKDWPTTSASAASENAKVGKKKKKKKKGKKKEGKVGPAH